MNGLAIIVGYCAMVLLAALVVSIPAGWLISRWSERGEAEQLPPPRPAVVPRRDTTPQEPAS